MLARGRVQLRLSRGVHVRLPRGICGYACDACARGVGTCSAGAWNAERNGQPQRTVLRAGLARARASRRVTRALPARAQARGSRASGGRSARSWRACGDRRARGEQRVCVCVCGRAWVTNKVCTGLQDARTRLGYDAEMRRDARVRTPRRRLRGGTCRAAARRCAGGSLWTRPLPPSCPPARRAFSL